MGKNLIQQARGKGSPTYKAPSFRWKAKIRYNQISKETIKGVVEDIIHCQGHSAPLMQIRYGEKKYYNAAPTGIKVGDEVYSGEEAILEKGNTMPLEKIPEGTLVYNIESNPGDGGKFIRSSGVFAKVIAKIKNKVIVLLPSKKEREFDPACRASIGIVAGGGRREKPFLKAGRMYHKMRQKNKLYPKVSGVSMNAVDHPFGGSSSHHKGRPTQSGRFDPPGRKVGKLRPRRTGRRKI